MHLLLKSDPERLLLKKTGLQMLKEKKVAVLTLAGGSGSRLEYAKPKGTFVLPTMSVPRLSLFQRQAKTIFSFGAPWIIMVSNETLNETIEHLQSAVLTLFDMDVLLIIQQDIDALDMATRQPLVNECGQIIKVPNGNGSVFKAIKANHFIKVSKDSVTQNTSSVLSELVEVEYFNIISVDNVLVFIADPVMLGYALKNSLDVVSAAVPEMPGRKMGTFEIHNQKILVTEYICNKSKNSPLFNAEGKKLANIANHLISKPYLLKIDPLLIPYNEAIKKIPHNADTSPVKPNAIKRELFIFDGFSWAKTHGVVEYGWNSYEGLKNKNGPADSIETCTNSLDNQ